MRECWLAVQQGDEIPVEELRLPRAIAIAGALRRLEDFSFVRCSRFKATNETTVEVIVFDVESHVPPNNDAGIKFRERIATLITESIEEPLEVLAVREGFPRLMHQNARPPQWPPSLCLYLAPQREVNRTWTAEKFVRRIQNWLLASARGELHPSDQPVEQLFFAAPYELVLPWNFEELSAKHSPASFVIMRGPERANEHQTFFLVPDEAGVASANRIAAIDLHLEPVVHGRIEPDPPTLGELAEMLEVRGASLLQALKDRLFTRIQAGASINSSEDEKAAVLVLHMPITRTAGGPIEKIARRGYYVAHGSLKLGELTGCLFQLDGKFYREQSSGAFAQTNKADWRALQIAPVEILKGLSRSMARAQSGVAEEGPLGVVVGVGALGATMLDLWLRSGWGSWTVIDKDHIKPHNLVRHPSDQSAIGVPKALVAAQRAEGIFAGASAVTAVVDDGCRLVDKKPLAQLQAAELVVDVSTSLDFPRLMSRFNGVARHVSVFVTPDGNDAVMLLEDADRHHRSRTLEAQYYRAVINEDWGKDHLAGNLGSFWSGAGCRDISVVMPYTRIMAHAALLAEQVRLSGSRAEAAISVWSRDPASGEVVRRSCAVRDERCFRLGDLDLFVDEGLISRLQSLRSEHLPAETGGVLLGYHDFNIGAIVIVDALRAPADSRSSQETFQRGIEGVASAVAEVQRRTAGVVGYVGEWHSHPPGVRADPSADDIYQLIYLALGLGQEGLPGVSLIVGDSGDIRVLECSANMSATVDQ